MWSISYLPFFSGLSESLLPTLPPCSCVQKRWFIGTGFLTASGIWLVQNVLLKGHSEWIRTTCTAGALCICLVISVRHEITPKRDDGKQFEEYLSTEKVTIQDGLHQKIINSCEKDVRKELYATDPEADEYHNYNEGHCTIKFSENKNAGLSKHDLVTSSKPAENISESLELHQPIGIQMNNTNDTNSLGNDDGNAFKFEGKIKTVRDNARRAPVAARFQEMDSIMHTSGIARNISSPIEEIVKKVVLKDNFYGDKTANEEEAVKVENKSGVTYSYSKQSKILPTSTPLDETAKRNEITTGNKSLVHRPTESTDEENKVF